MAKQRLTPEEQLLKLIEKGSEPETAKIKRRTRFFFSFRGLKNLKYFLGNGINRFLIRLKAGLKEPNLKVLNKVFLVLSAALLIYSIAGFIFDLPDVEKFYKKIQPVKEKRSLPKLIAKDRPFLHYLEMVRRRNIFSPIVLKETEKPEIENKQLQEIAGALRLVGISWSREPIVMIENKNEKKTYFLKKGDRIIQFKVKDILKDRVILDYNGELIELM